jgi:hypothetical protein
MTHQGNASLEAARADKYRAAVARAVKWLGDRYVLAKPIHTSPRRFVWRANR